MKNKKGFTLVELLIGLAIIGLIALFPVLAIWTDRSLEFWASYIKHQPVIIPYWLSLIVTIIGNAVIVGFNVISEVLRYFI